MFSYESLPPAKTILSAAASLTASALLLRTIASDLIPTHFLNHLFHRLSSQLTVVIHDSDGLTPNHLFQATNLYLGTKLSPSIQRIKVNKPEKYDQLTVTVDCNQPIIDSFQNVNCKWVLQTEQIEFSGSKMTRSELRFFELSFHKKHKETVLKNYLPYIINKAKEINEERKTVKLHTVDYNGPDYWGSVALNHPARFDTMAMDPDQKRELLEDLDVFIRRKDYYRRVRRA